MTLENFRSRVGPIALAILGILLFRPTPYQNAVAESIARATEAGAWGSADSALIYLEEALEREPDLSTLYPNLIQAALTSSNPAQANKYILKFQSSTPDDPRLPCWRIELHAKLGELDQVLEIWNQEGSACELDDDLIEVIIENLLAREDPQLLNQVISTLSQKRPSDPDIQFLRGLLLAISSPQNSLGTLRLANELAPQGNSLALELVRSIEDARILENQAYTLAQVGQVLASYSEWVFAARAFQAAIVIEPGYADAHAFLGLSLDELGMSGLESLQKAIELNPDSALPYIYLGMHWIRNGSPDQALQNLEHASELEPENPIIALQTGHALEIQGEIEAALSAYRTAAELAPQDGTMWMILAQVSLHHEFNVAGIGLPAARNAVALSPEDPMAVDALGYSYYLLGDLDYAERMTTWALELDPLNPQIQYHLGLLKANQNNYGSSKAAFEMVLLLDPEGEFGKLAQRALDTITP